MTPKALPTFLTALLLGAAPLRAEAPRFADVPANHWAYGAVQELAASGILEGHGGRFRGEQVVDRYQMAVVLKRTMDEVKRRRDAAGEPPVPDPALRQLEQTMIAFADELASLHVQVGDLEKGIQELRGELARP